MIISSETEIAAPPIGVWRVLSDFVAYPRWNPYRQVIGAAALGAKVRLMIGPKREQRRRLAAKISICPAIAWPFKPAARCSAGRWKAL